MTSGGTPARRVRTGYRTRYRRLPRAARPAREPPAAFGAAPAEPSPKPGTGVVRAVRADDEVVRHRREQGLPGPAAVERAVRDRVAPGVAPDHADRPGLSRPAARTPAG
ncbi:SelT/selW/selH domain protein [Streptomyces sp. TG1A-8]|uniref:SelT/selW/selH domain protein n=1 Tax=Streptomyces sp. TG1A-8 TaxID=3051385 RepID=UPI00265C1448|nr:SelT/selW/selH domain protein [Streptomyces sp. TG1A-8]MDO0924983.1 SelT/selW/selH domain protein [Streptomyces sp. TG1A-8]